jgi:hypothetical protein
VNEANVNEANVSEVGTVRRSKRRRPRGRRVARWVGKWALLVIAAFLIVRALVQPFVINPSRPETYRLDWGGPHYLGVMLVHCLPGVIAAILLVRWYRRTHPERSTRAPEAD